jgi:hypothetical protein
MEQIIFFAFFILQMGDYVTTLEILKRGGRELNPVMKWLMDNIGVNPALFFSKAVLIGLVWQANHFWTTFVIVILYMAVVGHNLFQLNKFYKWK